MKQLAFVFLLLVLTACKEISFENPQPEGRKPLHAMPKNLQGKYLTIEDDGQLSKDTVVITSNGYYFGYFDPAERLKSSEEYEQGILSDSLILKSYKGYYFLNINKKPEWLLRVIQQEKNGDLVYMSMEQKGSDFKEYLKKLSAEIRVDSTVLPEETLYQIDPTPGQLIELIDKGLFARSRLVKIK
jgi:hypothetical protein